MQLPFIWNPYSVLIFSTGVFALAVGAFIWTRRPGRGVTTITLLSLALAGWSFATALQIGNANLTIDLILRALVYLGVSLVPPLWFAFIAEYTGNEQWLTRRTFWLLAIHPIALQVALVTNPQHDLLWTDVIVSETPNMLPPIEYLSGPLFWVHAGYSYLLMLAATMVLVRSMTLAPQKYRGQMALLLVALLAPWVGNVLYLGGFSPLPEYVDITPMAFAVTGLAAAWSVYRFQLFDLAPVAHVSIFESMADAVFVLDNKNRVLDANPAALRILGLPIGDVIGQPGALLFVGASTLVNRYSRVMQAEEEITLIVAGEHRIFDMHVSPLRNRLGDLLGRTITLHDITSIKETHRQLIEAREQAEEATRLKSEFLATMSHELRTPLNAIEGFSSIMLSGMGVDLSPRAHDMISRISSNSQRLLVLVNDILDLSRIEAGRVEITPSRVAPTDLAKQWERDVSVLAKSKNLLFRVDVDPALPPIIEQDRYALTKIVTNLLSNAFKFTNEGRVTLALRRQGDQLQIIVSDTGIGIPPHAQDYIFDKFRQVDGTTTRQYGGSGLGLSLVQRLTQLLDGSITLESEMGLGSIFTVTVPLNEHSIVEPQIVEGALP